MKSSILVHRYTKAFFELAMQNDVVDKALDDLLLINVTLKENKELDTLIHQPLTYRPNSK